MLTPPMIILIFLELAYGASMLFAAFSFIEKFRVKSQVYTIWAVFISLASILTPLGVIPAQILFNGGHELLAGNIYKLLNFSMLLNAFFVFALITAVFELRRLIWAYPLIIILSTWFAYKTATTQIFLTFKNDMIQPLLTPELRSIFIPLAIIWVAEWLIFGLLAAAKSWMNRRLPNLSRSYLNLVYIAVPAMFAHILSAMYTYVNISWVYLAAWGFGVVWGFVMVFCLSAFKSDDKRFIYNPFNIFWRCFAYKSAASVSLAIFILIMIMAVTVGRSISYGLSKELGAIGVSREIIVAEIIKNQNLIVTMGLIGTVFMLLSVFIIIRAAIRPIEKTTRTMRKIETGSWDAAFEVYGEDEIGQLSRVFNDMVGKIREQTEELLRSNEALKKNHQEIEIRGSELQKANEELENKNRQLEQFKSLTAGRELREAELENEILDHEKGLKQR